MHADPVYPHLSMIQCVFAIGWREPFHHVLDRPQVQLCEQEEVHLVDRPPGLAAYIA
jgi:hypothetical protein